jgi:hypothetical protein
LNAGEKITIDEIERGFRDAALRDGNLLFTKILSEMKVKAPDCSQCGSAMRNQGHRSKNIVSLLGEGTISRDYYTCMECGSHAIPKDQLLHIESTSFTPGVRRSTAKLAACESFVNSSAALRELCGIYVSSKDTERIAHAAGAAIETEKVAQIDEVFSSHESPQSHKPRIPIMYIEYDGTGVPIMKRELFGRIGKQEDGTAKTREVKLGCIFTQVNVNEKGEPVREKNSTTYFGAIETSESFCKRLYMEASNRGSACAEKVVIIGDGAKWILNLAYENFPNAIQIVDIYHAKEHLGEYIKTVFSDLEKQAMIKYEWSSLLDAGDIEKLIFAMSQFITSNGPDKQSDLQRQVNYFKENALRMPDCLRRLPITCLQPASITPLPTKNPRSLK